jgi:hypothetical protein
LKKARGTRHFVLVVIISPRNGTDLAGAILCVCERERERVSESDAHTRAHTHTHK